MRSVLVAGSDHGRMLRWGLLLAALGVTFVVGAPAPTQPLVDLSAEPPSMNGAKTKGNLTLALSVEEPTVGQDCRGADRHKAQYDPGPDLRGLLRLQDLNNHRKR